MKVPLLLLCIFSCSLLTKAQTKTEFEKMLAQEQEKKDFTGKLTILNATLAGGIDTVKIDSLKKSGAFDFVSFKIGASKDTVIVLDLIPLQWEAYQEATRDNKIKVLNQLKKQSKLKATGRNVANEVEPPKKTNASQPYSQFYLEVIKKMMAANKSLLAQDQLSFETYLSWEKKENLNGEAALSEFRKIFILFLYKHYNIN